MISNADLKQWFINQYMYEFGNREIVLNFALDEFKKMEERGKLSLDFSSSFLQLNDILEGLE